MPNTLAARFWAKVDKSGECWTWTGVRDHRGYGRFYVGSRTNGTGRMAQAHRVAWEMEHGPIPDGMHVCHSCDNPPCVRHLFLGTAMDNMNDCVAKGRHPRYRAIGELNGGAKLTAADVERIRSQPRRRGMMTALAREYGVCRTTIQRTYDGVRYPRAILVREEK